ncbi:MAG: trypsin-like peptidase domain-containing protein [Actinomycetota bacterium]|nr:trypsin-like peptidase domain-containing protein [Actinomycetota bacterium]
MSEYPNHAPSLSPSYPPPPVPPPAARRRGRRIVAACALLATVALTGGAAGAATTALAYEHSDAAVVTSATVNAISGSAEPLSQVAAAVQLSVVTITVRTAAGEDIGSGVVYRSDGVILTNNHVVADAANGGTITVTLSTGRTVTADLVGQDATNDLALIKARGVTGLTPVTFGSLGDVAIGDTVLAFGSPLGLAGSVSAGIVSALGRTVTIGGNPSTGSPYGGIGSVSSTEVLHNAIQTDATINPGNSGGALVDTSGRLIGINTAIASTSSQSGSIGVGFAIPVTTVKTVADRLLRSAVGV